jgi:hypothetical protein
MTDRGWRGVLMWTDHVMKLAGRVAGEPTILLTKRPV